MASIICCNFYLIERTEFLVSTDIFETDKFFTCAEQRPSWPWPHEVLLSLILPASGTQGSNTRLDAGA